jgi:hypothetical protein
MILYGLFSQYVTIEFRALFQCAILPGMEENFDHNDWIEQIKTRGMIGAFDLTLDILEPIGPLAAQVLYTLQPLLGVFGLHGMVEDVAQALDEPDGVEHLRERIHRSSDYES